MIRPVLHHAGRVLIIASTAALLALPAIPAGADASKSVNLACTITNTVDLHPGVTTQPQHVTATTHGFTGTATCTGTIHGRPATGPGTFRADSKSVSSCFSTVGEGTFGVKIPTADGQKTVSGDFQFRSTAFPPGATILTGDLIGTATIVSANGDCFTTPITRSTAVDTVRVTA